MLGRLVTIETFTNPMQAHLVKNHLEAAGIHCVLADEHSVSNLWHLSGAIGGIKLQVAESDLERAEAVLAAIEHHSDDAGADSEDVGDDDADDETKPEPKPADEEEEDQEPPLNSREQNAERAYRAALIGMIFFPLQFYATWLLLSVWQEDTPLRPSVRRKLNWALLFNLPLVIVAFGTIGFYLRSMIYGVGP